MELDDFKPAWQAMSQKLDQQTALNVKILLEIRMERTRHGLRPLLGGQVIQMILGALVVFFSVGFWSNHRHVPHLLFIGLLLHVYGLAMVLFSVRMVVLIRSIDFGAPVLSIQKQLARLRRFYVVGGLWIGLPWWVLWIPVLMMVFMGLGVDLYTKAPQLVHINVVACSVGLVLTVAFLRWAQGRPKLARILNNSAAGSSLNRTQRLLDEIARFEQTDTLG